MSDKPFVPPARPTFPVDDRAVIAKLVEESLATGSLTLGPNTERLEDDLHLDRTQGGNSFDAHRLLHLAGDHGLADAMKERLLRGYFSEGEPVGDPATLARLAVEAGLPAAEVDDVLAGDRYAEAVRADERSAQALGATAAPFFVIDETYGIAGAQPPEVFTNVLERAWSER